MARTTKNAAAAAQVDPRVAKIQQIEAERNSRVISYVTNTRANANVNMALDVVRYVFEHLQAIKRQSGTKKPNIDLFLHSNGGDGTVPWRLVTLIREFADKFCVLVPYRAFSAATLTALGADEVLMHPMGMLGPTDATVTNGFNPVDGTGKPVGISVEDVTAYIQLIKEDAGIEHEDELVQAFNILASNVHPLALGNVKRSMSQSRMMARKLLELHMNNSQRHKIDEIVDNLTSKLFFHGHPINRDEAKNQIGIETIGTPSERLEKLMWDLFLQYEAQMKLSTPFDAALEFAALHDVSTMAAALPGNIAAPITVKPEPLVHVLVESSTLAHINRDEIELHGVKNANNSITVTLTNVTRGWSVTRSS